MIFNFTIQAFIDIHLQDADGNSALMLAANDNRLLHVKGILMMAANTRKLFEVSKLTKTTLSLNFKFQTSKLKINNQILSETEILYYK